LLLTWANTGVSGTEYDSANPAGVGLVGAPGYSLQTSGICTITLTAPSAQNYAIYIVDTSGTCTLANPACAIQDFLMIDETATNKIPSVIFTKQ
jgi:hypothetical protein